MKTRFKKHFKRFLQDESGQGTTEYILILVGVVALAVAFKDQIVSIVKEKTGKVGADIMGFGK